MQGITFTKEQRLVLYVAVGILAITYIAALFVGVVYLVVYPSRMIPYLVIGFLQTATTVAGFIVGNLMGIHIPLINQQQINSTSLDTQH